MKEEKKKQELEQQKKRLRGVNFSKPQVNFDDIFKKQIPVVQRPSPSDSPQNKMADVPEDTSSPRPPDNDSGVGGCGQGVESGPVGDALQSSVGGGSKGEEVGSGTNSNVITEPAPSTGIYYTYYSVCMHIHVHLCWYVHHVRMLYYSVYIYTRVGAVRVQRIFPALNVTSVGLECLCAGETTSRFEFCAIVVLVQVRVLSCHRNTAVCQIFFLTHTVCVPYNIVYSIIMQCHCNLQITKNR